MNSDPHVIFGREYPVQYDAIVIGAGIGGLICANLLAKDGMKVLLLERHYMLGGFCSVHLPAQRLRSSTRQPTSIRCWVEPPPRSLVRCWWNSAAKPNGFAWTRWISSTFPACPPSLCPESSSASLLCRTRLKEWFPAEAANIDAYFCGTPSEPICTWAAVLLPRSSQRVSSQSWRTSRWASASICSFRIRA